MAQEENSGDNKKRTIFVNGGSKGIGLEFAKICLKDHDNISLIVGCRSLNRIIKYDSNKSQQELKKDPDFWECIGSDGKVNANWNDGKHTRETILKDKFDSLMKTSNNKNNSVDFVEIDINTGANNINDEKINESYANARQSIDNGIKYIKDKYKNIDILVNNAGFAQKGPAFDFDVVTRTSSINYYGTKYLTESILTNKLINNNKGEEGRIIFVSSMGGSYAFQGGNKDLKTKFENIIENGKKEDIDEILQIFANAVNKDKNNVKYNNLQFGKTAYGMSKAGVSMYSRLLERDLSKDNCMIGIGAYCPGYCQSYMSSGGGNRTSEDGARGIELLCFDQKLDSNHGTNGQFWQLKVSNNGGYKLTHTPWKRYMHL